MHPKPSLHQCLVLHEIAMAEVKFRGDFMDSGEWIVTRSGHDRNVTKQIEKLIDGGYVRILIDFPTQLKIVLTTEGHEVIKRRPLHDVIEAVNRR